jgi:hypothetical protein
MLDRGVLVCSLVSCLLLFACGSDDGSSGGPGLDTARSPACLDLLDAECDYHADKCGEMSRAQCDDIFGSLFCESDATASACSAVLRPASCGETPQACLGIADRDRAQAVCSDLMGVFCAEIEKCAGTDSASCRAQLEAQVCSTAIGVRQDVDTCVAAVPGGCSPEGTFTTPPACQGVVKSTSQTASLSRPSGQGVLESSTISMSSAYISSVSSHPPFLPTELLRRDLTR